MVLGGVFGRVVQQNSGAHRAAKMDFYGPTSPRRGEVGARREDFCCVVHSQLMREKEIFA